jgi:hypothetical protein
MRSWNRWLLAGLFALIIAGCDSASTGGSKGTAGSPDASALPSGDGVIVIGNEQPSGGGTSSADVAEGDPDYDLIQKARDIVDILRDRDLERLAKQIDPELGLRFSPYAHIDAERHLRFTAGGLPSFQSTDKLVWGAYDGSGESIELTFREYFEKFVYDHDFASAPSITANRIVSQGNTPFNGSEIYPDADFVEFHFPGFDKQYEGMDWKSLILVLRPVDAEWKVCAIVHSQWTT